MPERRWTRWAEHRAAWAAPAALAAALLLVGIGNNVFWGDEAYTAILARNIVRTGRLTAWDGRNLLTFRGRAPLRESFTSAHFSCALYYTAAGGFALFGETTAAGRLPFAVMGVATVVAFYFLALRLQGSRAFALGCATALSVWVPFLLFARQCRYYAPAMLATVLMLYLWLDLSLKNRWRFAFFVLTSMFFFHNQFLMFSCVFAALFLTDVAVERRRGRLLAMLVTVPIVAASMLPWLLASGVPGDAEGALFRNVQPGRWLTLFLWYLRDYNRAGFFPALMLIPFALYVIHAVRSGKERAEAAVPVILVLTFTAVTALLSPQPITYTRFADIRYGVPAIPLLVLMLAQSIRWLGRRWAAAGLVVAVLCFGTDLLTLGMLRPGYADEIRVASPFRLPFRCLPAEHVFEITHDYETAYEAVIRHLGNESDQDDTVGVYPGFRAHPLMFHLGDRLRFVSVLRLRDRRQIARVPNVLPEDIYTVVKPDWIVGFGFRDLAQGCKRLGIKGDGEYAPAALEVYFHDTTRPELFWRTFGPVKRWAPKDQVFILRRRPAREAGRAAK